MMDYTYLNHEGKAIVIGSKMGPSHESSIHENQDSFTYGEDSKTNFFLAIADGVSSCKYAKRGSELAVSVIKSLFDDVCNESISLMETDEIRRYIVRRWKACIESRWNHYGTTLNFMILYNKLVLLGQIGDGFIIVDIDGDKFAISDENDFYSNETFALGECVRKSSFPIVVKKVTKFVNAIIMTDGIGKEIDSESIHELQAYLTGLAIESSEAGIQEELNAWISVLDKKNGDDKTIGILSWEV